MGGERDLVAVSDRFEAGACGDVDLVACGLQQLAPRGREFDLDHVSPDSANHDAELCDQRAWSSDGASGPVVAYQMNVMAGNGYAWGPGNYWIFPTPIAAASPGGIVQPRAYLSVVPDGVRRVRWHFTCSQAPVRAIASF